MDPQDRRGFKIYAIQLTVNTCRWLDLLKKIFEQILKGEYHWSDGNSHP